MRVTDEGSRNVRFGLVALPAGLLFGAALAGFCFVPLWPPPPGLEDYAGLPRRLLRLAHVAAVMLPLLNVVLGPYLDRLRLGARARVVASWLLIAGAVALPLLLSVEALLPGAARLHVSALGATPLVVGTLVVAVGASRGLAPARRERQWVTSPWPRAPKAPEGAVPAAPPQPA